MKKQITSIMLIFVLVLTMVAVPLTPSGMAYGAGEYVAEVDGIEYTSLEAAVTAAEAIAAVGQEEYTEVNLLNDVSLDTPIVIEENLTLVLHGNEITTEGANQRAFSISEEKNLIIDDSVDSGVVEGEIYLEENSALNIEYTALSDPKNIKYDDSNGYVLYMDDYTYPDEEIGAIQGSYQFSCVDKDLAICLGASVECDGVYIYPNYEDLLEQFCIDMGLEGELNRVAAPLYFYFASPADGSTVTHYYLNAKIGETISQAMERTENTIKEYDLPFDLYEEPQFPGAVFDGWHEGYFEANEFVLGDAVSFNTKVTDYMELYSTWLIDGEGVRIYGSNRFETSMKIADALKANMGVSRFGTVVVANGMNFADALAGTYLASVTGSPILTVDTDAKIEAKVKDYIDKNVYDGGTIYLLGGTGVVSTAFEKSLKAEGYNVVRLGGKDRFETNIKILKEAGVTNEDIMVCSAYGFADSLSASAVGLPILLVDDKLTAQQKEYLNSVETEKFYLIGGKGVVKSTIDNELKAKFGATERVAGVNRFETSVAVARKFFGSEYVYSAVAAYAMDFPDGLAGGPLAYVMGAPLLLVTDEDAKVAAEYTKECDISSVVPLGGPTLISDWTVFQKLAQ